jgi:hypothetical protein
MQRARGAKMKALFWVGMVVVILGVLSLVVPIPRTERHGIQVGDASVGIKTQTEEKVSPIVSVVMIAGGALMMFGGGRGRAAA